MRAIQEKLTRVRGTTNGRGRCDFAVSDWSRDSAGLYYFQRACSPRHCVFHHRGITTVRRLVRMQRPLLFQLTVLLLKLARRPAECRLNQHSNNAVHTAVVRHLRSHSDFSFNLLRWNHVPRTSRIFCPKIAISSQFYVCLSITQAKKILNLLLLDNFYPVIYRHEFKKKATNCCIRSLVMVRNQLPAQVVNPLHWNDVSRTSKTFCP